MLPYIDREEIGRGSKLFYSGICYGRFEIPVFVSCQQIKILERILSEIKYSCPWRIFIQSYPGHDGIVSQRIERCSRDADIVIRTVETQAVTALSCNPARAVDQSGVVVIAR